MPTCKNCKSRIDKFNKDICPICGVEHPFEGVSSQTMEVTTPIDVDHLDYKPRKRSILLLTGLTLGWTGLHFFYLKKNKLGYLTLILSLLFIVSLGLILGLCVENIALWAGFLIGFALSYFINAFITFVIYLTPNYKDGRGEFTL